MALTVPTRQSTKRSTKRGAGPGRPPTRAKAKTQARAPTVIRKTVEPLEEKIGQDGVVEGKDDSPDLIMPVTEDLEDPVLKEKLEYERFMAEMVSVYIQPSSDRAQVDQVFDISVNGKSWIFRRGEEFTIPRYVVAGLCYAKQTAYENLEYTDNDGERKVKWPSRTGVRYPFSVVHDPHPRGADWLRHILRQP